RALWRSRAAPRSPAGRSQTVLASEAAGVHRRSLAALQHDLAEPDAGVDGERVLRDVRHLEHLTAVHAGRDEAGGDVDHEPQPGIAAPSLATAGQIGRQPDALSRDAEDRLPRTQYIGPVESSQASDGPVVGVV